MKWVKHKTGRFERRPHYLPEELDGECEQIIRAFLTAKYGKVQFPVKTDDLTMLIEEKATSIPMQTFLASLVKWRA